MDLTPPVWWISCIFDLFLLQICCSACGVLDQIPCSLLPLLIKTPQMFHNQLPRGVKLEIFVFSHLKHIVCHIVWIKRQFCLNWFNLIVEFFVRIFSGYGQFLDSARVIKYNFLSVVLVGKRQLFFLKGSYQLLTEGGARGLRYFKKTQKKTRRQSWKRSRGCLHHPPGSDDQKRRKMAFTFAAFCYMLALLLTAALIFFAIWHVSTSRGDTS